MAQLKSVLDELQLYDLRTYIQSGNIVFRSKEENREHLESQIQDAIVEAFNFEVPVMVRSRQEFGRILEKNPFTAPEDIKNNKVYFAVLKTIPDNLRIKEMGKLAFENEKFAVSEDCVYFCCANGYGKAKLNNNLIEQKLKVQATTRNHNTMVKLLGMAE